VKVRLVVPFAWDRPVGTQRIKEEILEATGEVRGRAGRFRSLGGLIPSLARKVSLVPGKPGSLTEEFSRPAESPSTC
jgi:hypothetical protein